MSRFPVARLVLLVAFAFPSLARAADPPPALTAESAGRFAALALKCLHQEYPNKISHTLKSDEDARPPRELTPAFFGCYDWHSAVHGHWLLVRLVRLYPDAAFALEAREKLARSFAEQSIATEVAYLERADRASFERPYGLAWLLQLSAELREWDDPQARQWTATLAPLADAAVRRLKTWLPKLQYPIRVGEHSQTAFAFGLVWDWARVSGDAEMRTLLESAARRFYRSDTSCPLAYEPSGEDFLSPCLAEADFMRRVLDRRAFSDWLARFLPGIPENAGATWLNPGIVTDRSDPKLAHIDGLNLSRAWMLEGISSALDSNDRRVAALQAAAVRHRDAALPAVTGEHYEGGHWLGTFAVYLTSKAGIRRQTPVDEARLQEFGRRYTAAWCSQNAASVAAFFAEGGSLTVNGGAPAVGRPAIAAVARGFMGAFPDMVVTMDGVSADGVGAVYRWTLTGTNTGPGGTGRAVRISGYEEWTMSSDGLIARSLGHFDEAEYKRQLTAEVGKK